MSCLASGALNLFRRGRCTVAKWRCLCLSASGREGACITATSRVPPTRKRRVCGPPHAARQLCLIVEARRLEGRTRHSEAGICSS